MTHLMAFYGLCAVLLLFHLCNAPYHTFIFTSPSPPIKHCLPKECLISFHRFSPERFLFMGQAKKKRKNASDVISPLRSWLFWPIGNFVISHALCASLMFITHKWTHIDWYFSTSPSSSMSLAVFSGCNFCIVVGVFAVCPPPTTPFGFIGKIVRAFPNPPPAPPLQFYLFMNPKGTGASERGCSLGQFPPTDTINYINKHFCLYL